MQRGKIFLASGLFLWTSGSAIARQNSFAASLRGPEQAPAIADRSCTPNLAVPGAPALTRAQGADESRNNPTVQLAGEQESINNVDFDRDLKILQHSQTELAECAAAKDPDGDEQESQGGCVVELLVNFEMRHDGEPELDVPIGRLPGTSAFFYESGMTIDADGAPNAYHPENVGLDDLANAGTPGRWEGLAKDSEGQPIIQGPNDPFPGYYVSATALADRSKPMSDPTRYVDATKIPFVVLPGGMARQLGARPGDFAVVFNQRNGKGSYAIFGDVGPFDRIGEGSMALAENLGIRSDARNGGARRGILFLVFPGSGNGKPRTIEEIEAEGQKLLLEWEASVAPVNCTTQQTQHVSDTEGSHGAN